MKKFLFAVLAGLAFSSPAFAACDGLEGKDLEKCQKKEEKAAKVDSRQTPLLPSEIDAKFAAMDANNPFAMEAYKVGVTPTGIAMVDDYLKKVFIIRGKVTLARYMVDNFGAEGMDPAAMKAQGQALVELLKSIPADGKALADEGKKFADPNSLKTMLTSPADILKIPKVVPAVGDALGALTKALGEVDDVAKSLAGKVG